MSNALPVIDVGALVDRATDRGQVALQIGAACREHGFFYAANHGIDMRLIERLDKLSRAFFALPVEQKLRWRMELGGPAWRGYFPPGGELTSGQPDWKEGLYFGSELTEDDPRVKAGTPMHGRNLLPEGPGLQGFGVVILEYLAAVTQLGHRLLEGVALSLDLPPDYFHARYTADPLILFRIFNYPSQPPDQGAPWGVGEHTDYGLLTLLHQDTTGGLQVRTARGWIDAVPLPGTFVINIGDMLDGMTGGRYRSTPHRVLRNSGSRDRLSFPLFLDPNFEASVQPIENTAMHRDRPDARSFEGRYGDYLLQKVGRVFPRLLEQVRREGGG